MTNQTIRYIFILSLILILVAYFAGTVNIVNAVAPKIQGLIYAGSGRTQQGTFAPYPAAA